MSCSQCQGIEREFNKKSVAKELKRYREKGASSFLGRTTRTLIDALKTEGIEGMTLLDIGGGIGVAQHELLASGVSKVVSVDASRAYIEAQHEEAKRLGLIDRITHLHGDFVELASSLEPEDIVTLDKVICCYHDMSSLVRLSSAKARTLYGLVYPRSTWWVRLALYIFNFVQWLRRCPFRSFVHPTAEVDALVRSGGFARRFYQKTAIWQVLVYSRQNLDGSV